jgi:hypothetical protein
VVPTLESDRFLADDIATAALLVSDGNILDSTDIPDFMDQLMS